MKTTIRHVRIPDDVWEMLRFMGRREGRSASAELVQALRKHTSIPYEEDEAPLPRRARSHALPAVDPLADQDDEQPTLCIKCHDRYPEANHVLCSACRAESNRRHPPTLPAIDPLAGEN